MARLVAHCLLLGLVSQASAAPRPLAYAMSAEDDDSASSEDVLHEMGNANCKYMSKAAKNVKNGKLGIGRYKNKCADCKAKGETSLYDQFCPKWMASDYKPPRCPDSCGLAASDRLRDVTCQVDGKEVDTMLCQAAQEAKPQDKGPCSATPPCECVDDNAGLIKATGWQQSIRPCSSYCSYHSWANDWRKKELALKFCKKSCEACE